MKKVLTAVLFIMLFVFVAAGCGKTEEEKAAEVTTIYIGTHAQGEDDPNWVNSVTGEPTMSPDRLRAANMALATVKEELGVDIKWKLWPHSVQQDALQSVLANDPFCHIAILSNGIQGRVMGQNVLQPLDNYMDIFEEEDAQFLKTSQTFGANYLLNRDLLFIKDWPICFNIDMLEAVPSLRENGRTRYPYDLYKKGEWTWSTFEDYLTKIQLFYAGKKSAQGRDIVPFNTRYPYTILQAMHSNGAYLYNGKEMAFASREAVEAAEYLDSLMQRGLVSCSSATFGKSANNGYLNAVDAFINGETVFTNCARWRMGAASNAMAERGESMGIIFFPRPDSIPHGEYGTTKYEIAMSCADSVGLLRGFSEAESRLALEAYKLYKIEFYKNLGRVDTIKEYYETMAPNEAIQFGIDIFHPEIGNDNLEIFEKLGAMSENEFGEAMSIIWSFADGIFGNSVYGVGGSPKYAIAVESKKQQIYDSMNNIADALKTDTAIDAVAPGISQTDNKPIVFGLGTKPETIIWEDIIKASDNVDGDYELKSEKGKLLLRQAVEEGEEGKKFESGRADIDISAVDFNTVGKYEDALVVKVRDTYGNEGEKKFSVYIYDDENTKAPILALNEEPRVLEIDADTSKVDWGRFVEKAEDVMGIDLIAYVSADVTMLDVTKEGVYPVTVYVNDFAGNKTEIETEFKIEKPNVKG